MSLTPTLPCGVLVGDSITQNSWENAEGLASRLSLVFVRRLDIINRGYSGYTSRDVLPLALELFRPAPEGSRGHQRISFITLFLGANDATLFGAQHVPLAEYTSNLGRILDLLPAGVPKVLITPPIPQGDVWAASKGIAGLEPNRSEANTARYAEACREVAQGRVASGVELVDLWQAMDDYRSFPGQQLGDLLTDGLHLSARGYKILSDSVLGHLQHGSAVDIKPEGTY